MNKFYFNGEIVSRESDKTTLEDITPYDFQKFIDQLNDGEDIQLFFNSFGGDCFSALQICSMLKDAQKNGHRTIANITSCACSSASFIACSCGEINLYEGCYIMVHLPWTVIQGNAMDLSKEISTLEQMKNSMVKIYRTKFNLTDDEICSMLENETWIDSDNYKDYGLQCNVIENDTPVRISASIKNKRFNNIPKGINMEEKKIEQPVEDTEQEKTQEEVEETQTMDNQQTPEEETKETPVEDSIDEDDEDDKDCESSEIEELKAKVAELEEQLKKYETESVEDRVRGMQSKMQSRINTLEAEHTTRIKDFENQLKAKNAELETIKNESISLRQNLEKTSKELDETLSALNDKEIALSQLNSCVLAKPEKPISYKDGLNQCRTPEERIAYIRSGNYTI